MSFLIEIFPEKISIFMIDLVFHFLKVYINGIMVELRKNISTKYEYLSQDWGKKAGIGEF